MATAKTEADESDRLAKMDERFQAGLLLYDSCEIDELRKFCVQRKLPLPANGDDKNIFIDMLEKADDEPRFELFSNLPAELRVRIYEQHMLDLCYGGHELGSLLSCEPEPPITQVSRLLRKEALPVFYDIVPLSLPIDDEECFALHFSNTCIGKRPIRAIERLEQRFYRRVKLVPARALSRFKRLQIVGMHGIHDLFDRDERCKVWEVDLAQNGKDAQVRCFAVAADGARQQVVEDGGAAECRARIDEVLRIVAQRGDKRLRVVDKKIFAQLTYIDWVWEMAMRDLASLLPMQG